MRDGSPQKNSPPAVGATEGQCTALRAGAQAAYGNDPAAGKRFSHPPVLTGKNSRDGGLDSVLTAGNSASAPPPANDELLWAWPKRGGEVRASLGVFRGSRFLNIRWWAEKPGEHVATQKGVTIPLDAIEDLAGALTAFVAKSRSSER